MARYGRPRGAAPTGEYSGFLGNNLFCRFFQQPPSSPGLDRPAGMTVKTAFPPAPVDAAYAFARNWGGGRRGARAYPERLVCSRIFPSRGGAVPPPSPGIDLPGRGRLAHLPAFAVIVFSEWRGMMGRPSVGLRFFRCRIRRRSLEPSGRSVEAHIMNNANNNFRKFR